MFIVGEYVISVIFYIHYSASPILYVDYKYLSYLLWDIIIFIMSYYF